MTPSSRSVLRGILAGGLVAGILDITDALVFHGLRGVSPVRILQAIASGLLGRDAFAGGAATAALGLSLHFVIAFGAAAVYGVASRRLSVLVERPWLAGPIFGLAVPTVVPGVPSEVLIPRSTWPDPAAYDAQARKLSTMFRENFEHYRAQVPGAVAEAGPTL